MKPILALSLASLIPISFAAALTSNVTTSNGPVYGNARDANGVLSFMGIPYAQPPTGSLRWRPPITPTSWSNPIAATSFGATCYSFATEAPPTGPQSENCLTVNVWTGANQTTELRPVMVWIYGGGFQFGSSGNPTYDGTRFAEDGVVLISFNYRLGNFGFLALPQLDTEGPNSGNFGLQDQIFLLQWVKKNIAAFGGDPNNVLIFGESAGAHSVGLLMSSPLTKGLFNKAILESGAWWDSNHGSLSTFAQARQLGSAFTSRVGATSLTSLRALSAATVVSNSMWNVNTDPTITASSPSIDNYVLQSAPGTIWEAGKQAQVPLLAGWNGDEQLPFLPFALPHNSAAEFIEFLPLQFDGKTQQALNTPDLYPASNDTQANASATALIGDLVIREQTWEAADTQRKSGGGSSVFVYYYTYTSVYSPVPAHTAEVPFVFNTFTNNPLLGSTTPPTAADLAFGKQIMTYWVNFAKTSNPNGSGQPTWPPYIGAGSDILGLGNTIAPVDYDLDRFKFIQGFRTGGVLPTSWRSINVSEYTG